MGQSSRVPGLGKNLFWGWGGPPPGRPARAMHLSEAAGRQWADLGHRGWHRSVLRLAVRWPSEERSSPYSSLVVA